MIKKLSATLAVLLTSASINTYAALPTGAPRFEVCVPCFNGGFSFGAAALYLRPSTPDIDYALLFPAATPTTTAFTNGVFKSVEPDYSWGWRINVGYLFKCTGNDIFVTYTNYISSDSDSVTRPPSGQLIPTTGNATTTAAFGLSGISIVGDGKARFDYEAVDLDFGQNVNVGCALRLRLFGGLRWVQLEHKFNTHFFEQFTATTTRIYDNHQDTDFKGIGPRFGIDGSYHIGSGFGIIGHIATALLVGDLDTSFDDSFISETGTVTVSSFVYGSDTRVAPNIDAKLGFDYTYQWCNDTRSTITIEVGYMADHYFNTIDRTSSENVTEPDNLIRNTIDTSFDGPYIAIQIRA